MAIRFRTMQTTGLVSILTFLALAMLVLGGTTGSSTVTAQGDATPTAIPTIELPEYQSEPEPILVNTSLEGTLTAGQTYYVYSHIGVRRSNVSVYLTADHAQAYLEFYSEQFPEYNHTFEVIASSTANTYESGVSFEFWKEVPFWVIIRNPSGRELHYTLELRETIPQMIVYDKTIIATFGSENDKFMLAESYDFEGQAGDIITVTVHSDTVDTHLSLSKLDYIPIGSDKSSGPGFNPELYHMLLPEDGIYRLYVMSEQPIVSMNSGVGEVEILIKEEPYPSLPLDEYTQMIYQNDVVSQTFVFTGTAHQTATLSLYLTEFYAEISVSVRQGEVILAESTPFSLVSIFPRSEDLEFTIPADGEVRIIVQQNDIPNYVINPLKLRLHLGE